MAISPVKSVHSNVWFKRFVAIFPILLVVYLVLFHILAPQPSVQYLTKVLNKIDAPSGFITSYSDIRSGGIGESAYASRTYTGTGSYQSLKEAMLVRVKDAGFVNATWHNESLSHAAGIYASCDAAYIGVYIAGSDDKSTIQVEVLPGNTSYFVSNCPSLSD